MYSGLLGPEASPAAPGTAKSISPSGKWVLGEGTLLGNYFFFLLLLLLRLLSFPRPSQLVGGDGRIGKQCIRDTSFPDNHVLILEEASMNSL